MTNRPQGAPIERFPKEGEIFPRKLGERVFLRIYVFNLRNQDKKDQAPGDDDDDEPGEAFVCG